MERKCRECGSERIAPVVRLGGAAHPASLLGQLRARVCADCGYTELRAENPLPFYLEHERSVQSQPGRAAAGPELRAPEGAAANIQCPSCGSVIPAASTTCEACGWSQDSLP